MTSTQPNPPSTHPATAAAAPSTPGPAPTPSAGPALPRIDPAADAALKARHRALWALGNYPAVAAEIVGGLGRRLVTAAGVREGQDVLDLAAGSGNVALPAAQAGARVVALDLTPELLEAGRAAAQAQGLVIRWREGDAERLPCDGEDFDVVLSSVGVMFAPHHQAAADEIVRVCRPGGTVALINWTPTGFIGQLFATMKPFVPSPPPDVQPPPLWGVPEHVRGLFADRVEVTFAVENLRVDRFTRPGSFRRYFAANYGPTIAAYAGLRDDPARAAALDEAIDALVARFDLGGGAMEWEYLLALGAVR